MQGTHAQQTLEAAGAAEVQLQEQQEEVQREQARLHGLQAQLQQVADEMGHSRCAAWARLSGSMVLERSSLLPCRKTEHVRDGKVGLSA